MATAAIISSVIAILMAILTLFDRFTSRVTPVELEKRITEIYKDMADMYPAKSAFNDVKEKIDKIYDIIIKRVDL